MNRTKKIAVSAAVGALYAVLTMVLAPISYGPVQLRVSEALCILPFFMPETALGLFAGCMIANLMTGNIFDIIFGSLATLAAGVCTALIGKKSRKTGNAVRLGPCAAGCAMPVIFNAIVVGAIITGAYNGLNIFENFGVFVIYALQIAAGEAIAMYVIGLPLMMKLPDFKFFKELIK